MRPMAPSTPTDRLAGELRRVDYDRYLCALFAAPEARAGMIALYAFSHEVAKIPEVVSEPMLGEIRLQWWREAIEGIYDGAARRHDVVEALAEGVARFDWPRDAFDALIDARAADLAGTPPENLGALESYADATSGALQALALRALDPATGEAASGAARVVGIGWALTGLLRAAPFHARQGRIALPADLLDEAGVSREALCAGRPGEGLRAVARAVADAARGHLAKARAVRAGRRSLPALLPARLATVYLDRLAAADYDLFASRTELTPLGKQARLMAARLRGRV